MVERNGARGGRGQRRGPDATVNQGESDHIRRDLPATHEKHALRGTAGYPSDSNRYVTEESLISLVDISSVTQTPNKTSAVTVQGRSCRVVTSAAVLNAGTEAPFTVTNASVAATDCIVVNHISGGTTGAYGIFANAITNGSFQITITNLSGANLGEALTLAFVVLKTIMV